MPNEQPGVSAGRASGFVGARTLIEYPRGGHRWGLLLLTMLASILASYEFQLAPLLPLLLPYLHMSRVGYGYLITTLILLGGISAFYGGPLADRYGRVLVIDVCLAMVIVLVFANLLITNIPTFVIVRAAMGIVAGLMAGALAALVRDMSPRLTRALSFGMLTIGPVGSSWLVTYVAGATLPIYHTWQSQIWIMGFIGIAMYVPIAIWLSDLSPELRVRIFKSEMAVMAAEGRRLPTPAELPASTRDAYARLLKHLEIWLLVIGIQLFLILYTAIQAFGPLIFTDAFHYAAADAARLTSYFWLFNIASLLLAGFVSDRLQLRKPIAILGAVLVAALTAYWIPMFGHAQPERTLAIVASMMGCFLAIAYVPWAAQFSETLEDISPALQATGWAFFGLVARATGAITAPVSLYVAVHHGWGAWIWVSACAMIGYIIAMSLSQGRFYRAAKAAVAVETAARAAALTAAGVAGSGR